MASRGLVLARVIECMGRRGERRPRTLGLGLDREGRGHVWARDTGQPRMLMRSAEPANVTRLGLAPHAPAGRVRDELDGFPRRSRPGRLPRLALPRADEPLGRSGYRMRRPRGPRGPHRIGIAAGLGSWPDERGRHGARLGSVFAR